MTEICTAEEEQTISLAQFRDRLQMFEDRLGKNQLYRAELQQKRIMQRLDAQRRSKAKQHQPRPQPPPLLQQTQPKKRVYRLCEEQSAPQDQSKSALPPTIPIEYVHYIQQLENEVSQLRAQLEFAQNQSREALSVIGRIYVNAFRLRDTNYEERALNSIATGVPAQQTREPPASPPQLQSHTQEPKPLVRATLISPPPAMPMHHLRTTESASQSPPPPPPPPSNHEQQQHSQSQQLDPVSTSVEHGYSVLRDSADEAMYSCDSSDLVMNSPIGSDCPSLDFEAFIGQSASNQ
jgi:hypothetical protein